jgi:hypothetical protein
VTKKKEDLDVNGFKRSKIERPPTRCDDCGKRPWVRYVTKQVTDFVSTMYLCEQCLKDWGF